MMVPVYIGLGSNLSEPLQQLKRACHALAQLPDSRIVRVSSFYASKPMGPQDQPDYVNGVAKLETCLEPIALLDALQAIEHTQGRERSGSRWGARTLDLDILLYGSLEIHSERLTIPHYGLKDREFVVYPLDEIAPDLQLPCGNALKTILNNLPRNGLSKMDLESFTGA